MIEFAADFETSKEVNYIDVGDKEFKAYKFEKNKDSKKDELVEIKYKRKIVDKANTKTWVYLWGIRNLENENSYKIGYDIKSFIDYIRYYPEDMKIYFHNLKFDGSFILNYFLNNYSFFKQLIEADNNNTLYKGELLSVEDKDNKFEFYETSKTEKFYAKKHFVSNGFLSSKGLGKKDGVFYSMSVNEMGVMYSIRIYFVNKGLPLHIVELYDSLKILNYTIKSLGEKFLNKKNMEKLEYDYDVVRQANRPDLLTEEDENYLRRDIDILAESLVAFKELGDIEGDVNRNTIASIALSEFKKLLKKDMEKELGKKLGGVEDVFRTFFPEFDLETDYFVRRSYKGGFCYVLPEVQNKVIENLKNNNKGRMCVLDVNSLFPFIMNSKPMPYGEPFRKKLYMSASEINPTLSNALRVIRENRPDDYDYYFVKITVDFKVKKNHIPSIMLKGADIKSDYYGGSKCVLPPDEYLESSDGNCIELIMAKDDFELMTQQYNIKEIYVLEVWYFKTFDNLFKTYIDKWGNLKIKAGLEGNKTLREICKLFLNSLYGKFGSHVKNQFKFFDVMYGRNITRSKIPSVCKPIYVPLASAITAGARRKTIETSQKILDYSLKHYGIPLYFYSDTDSIHTGLNIFDCQHCLGTDLDIDDTGELGLWKAEEKDIVKAKYIRSKTYLEEKENGEICTGVAGLPKEMQKCLKWNMFETDTTFYGKLTPMNVRGGIILLESEFTLKL